MDKVVYRSVQERSFMMQYRIRHTSASCHQESAPSEEQDLAMNFSPLEKKKNAPEAPPCVRRSLIVVEKYLHRKD
jgi:hypothetical protein